MLYLYAKAIHIVFVVSWMAGLFYIVRLFIYHTEAKDKSPEEQAILFPQFELMERRLMNIITTPAMVLSVLAGLVMIHLNPFLVFLDWFLLKLFFVALLIAYHFSCLRIMKDLRKGIFIRTSTRLRVWNEGATMLLVAIVFTVILRSMLDWVWGVIGLVLLGIVMMIAIKLYKNSREQS